ncbi:hypothetical protein GC194_04110 [bacterium]|nr:hypothetical protein [bacterium]
MKNTVIIGLLLIMLAPLTALKAQSLEKGTVNLSAGYGFANLSKGIFNTTVNGFNDSLGTNISKSSLGPLYFKAEYGVGNSFSIGLNVAYIGMSANWSDKSTGYTYDVSRNNVSFLARFNGYFVNTDNFQFYAGMGIGYRAGGWNFTTNDPVWSETFPTIKFPLGFEATLGFRAFVIENLAIYGELGASKGLAQLGLTYKL